MKGILASDTSASFRKAPPGKSTIDLLPSWLRGSYRDCPSNAALAPSDTGALFDHHLSQYYRSPDKAQGTPAAHCPDADFLGALLVYCPPLGRNPSDCRGQTSQKKTFRELLFNVSIDRGSLSVSGCLWRDITAGDNREGPSAIFVASSSLTKAYELGDAICMNQGSTLPNAHRY